ncbi:tetratricopeptide repeat protein [Rubritalea sp.]|uniref:tetratricopeptide repeat protein n=1 Tax=Rubritalea sp. TaxID=2109375 RepID=UPI003EF3F88D
MKSLILILFCTSSCFAADLTEVKTLGELFDKGEYQEAIKASKLAYENGDKEAGLYVAAASSSLIGEYRNAVRFCRKYLDENQNGRFQVEIAYYYGVSLARMGYRERAEFLLKQLVESAEGRYKNLSLYELGLLELNAGNYASARAYGEQLVSSEPSVNLRVQAQLLLGKVLETTRERALAEEYYTSAYREAESNQLAELQAEALFYLVAFYGREKIMGEPNTEMAKALPYYDLFEQNFAQTEYRAQTLVAALPALNEAGRSKEVIEKLELVLQELISSGEEAGMQDTARAILWERINEGEEISEIRKELIDESASGGRFYIAIMRSALADIYEIGAEQAHLSWGRKMKFLALARGLRCGLLELPDSELLPTYVQLQLGGLLLDSKGAPSEAEEYFERASVSKVEERKLLARLGVAMSLAQQDVEGLNDSLSVLRDLEVRSEGDISLYSQVLLNQMLVLDQLGKWPELEQKAQLYLAGKKLKKNRNQVHYLLAKSYDRQDLVEDAIGNYTQIFTAATGNLPISAPAVERLTELTWERNKAAEGGKLSDRQIAYQLASRYLSLIEDSPEWRKQMPEVQIHLLRIRENMSLWEESGEVESVEEILEQMRKGERVIIRK